MENYAEERFLYTVYPRRPIKNLNELIPIIRVPKTLSLNKEEVLKCFECGNVYRRFSNDGKVEKITKYDVDRVHRPVYISPTEWKIIMSEAKDVNNLVVNGAKAEETSVEVQEVKEETPVAEEPVIEEVKVEEPEVVVEEVTEVIEETPVEEVVEDDQVVEEKVEESVESTEDTIVEDTKVEAVEEGSGFEGEDLDEEAVETEEISNNHQQVSVNYNNKKKNRHH